MINCVWGVSGNRSNQPASISQPQESVTLEDCWSLGYTWCIENDWAWLFGACRRRWLIVEAIPIPRVSLSLSLEARNALDSASKEVKFHLQRSLEVYSIQLATINETPFTREFSLRMHTTICILPWKPSSSLNRKSISLSVVWKNFPWLERVWHSDNGWITHKVNLICKRVNLICEKVGGIWLAKRWI